MHITRRLRANTGPSHLRGRSKRDMQNPQFWERAQVFQWSLGLFILNIAGAIAYLYAVRLSWAIPEERAAGIYSVTGEPLVWFAAVLPFVVGFGLLNALWGLGLCFWRKWRSGYFWLATIAIWLTAVVVDFAHH